MTFWRPTNNALAQVVPTPPTTVAGVDPLAWQPSADVDLALSDKVNIVPRSSAMPKNSTRFDVNFRLNGEVPLFMV